MNTAMADLSITTVLTALFVVSFAAATVLPGGSEVALVAAIHRHPELLWSASAVATVGNTLGAMTSYGIGRLIPNRVRHASVVQLQRYGYWALLLAWLPLVGDALAVAAGWLRLDPWISIAALAIGKLARYLLVAGAWIGAAWLLR
jgi:membrane protein YqaA with SNARE-associated domain